MPSLYCATPVDEKNLKALLTVNLWLHQDRLRNGLVVVKNLHPQLMQGQIALQIYSIATGAVCYTQVKQAGRFIPNNNLSVREALPLIGLNYALDPVDTAVWKTGNGFFDNELNPCGNWWARRAGGDRSGTCAQGRAVLLFQKGK